MPVRYGERTRDYKSIRLGCPGPHLGTSQHSSTPNRHEIGSKYQNIVAVSLQIDYIISHLMLNVKPDVKSESECEPQVPVKTKSLCTF